MRPWLPGALYSLFCNARMPRRGNGGLQGQERFATRVGPPLVLRVWRTPDETSSVGEISSQNSRRSYRPNKTSNTQQVGMETIDWNL